MRTLLSLIISLLFFTIQGIAQSFPFQELTIDEFVKFERSLGSTIEELNRNEIISMGVAKDVYPYVDNYNLAQPYQGERPIDADSTVASIETYYDKNSENVKFISYSYTPKAKSPQEIAMELQAEGGYSEDEIGEEFVKRLNNQQSNPVYQEKITEKYETLRQYFAEKGKLIENRERSKDIVLTQIKTYKIGQAFVELSITHMEDLHKPVNVDIFWE